MKIKTSELTGPALDWAVAKCDGFTPHQTCMYDTPTLWRNGHRYSPSTDWSEGGPIIDRENISVIRLDDEDIPDSKGFWTGKKVPQWGAVMGDRHSPEEQYGSQGDYWGRSYQVDEDAMCGPTPLIAAMRCYVASKLGDTVDIPGLLVIERDDPDVWIE